MGSQCFASVLIKPKNSKGDGQLKKFRLGPLKATKHSKTHQRRPRAALAGAAVFFYAYGRLPAQTPDRPEKSGARQKTPTT